MQSGVATSDQLDAWQSQIQAEVSADIEKARMAPWPEVSSLFDFV
jgi:TPP-dependent pyruvate/acetoin dehydrogenase alpha subunit